MRKRLLEWRFGTVHLPLPGFRCDTCGEEGAGADEILAAQDYARRVGALKA